MNFKSLAMALVATAYALTAGSAVAQSGGAKVIINPHSGNVVITENVQVRNVALTHRNIRIIVSEEVEPRRPRTRDRKAPNTTVRRRSGGGGGGVFGGGGRTAILLPVNVDLAELVHRLKRARARPRDLIAILQAIKRAGALDAEIIVR